MPIGSKILPFVSSFYNSAKAQGILGIVERLRLGSSKRVTANVIRNEPTISLADQRRNHITLDETTIASPSIMEYDFSQLPVSGAASLDHEFSPILNHLCLMHQSIIALAR